MLLSHKTFTFNLISGVTTPASPGYQGVNTEEADKQCSGYWSLTYKSGPHLVTVQLYLK